ncbi:hypothetical protein PHSC3_000916 [Chlamydiales bacterium STE3]|nr:hypothetical protein PHSC3_000916 [Chlamydiales bacterium STE3]
MNVSFQKTSYLKAVKENNDLKKISNHASKKLQFKYVDITFQKFNKEYSAKGWFERKIIALPGGFVGGIVMAICHLAKAFIISPLKGFSDGRKYFKAQLFYSGRDFQESFGWLISFFNDRYGQYHIQESEFHRTCYDWFIQGDLDKEFEEINRLQDSEEKDFHLAKLAEAYYTKGDRKNALKTSKLRVYGEHFLDEVLIRSKENFIQKIARSYYKEGNLDAAYKTIEDSEYLLQ